MHLQQQPQHQQRSQAAGKSIIPLCEWLAAACPDSMRFEQGKLRLYSRSRAFCWLSTLFLLEYQTVHMYSGRHSSFWSTRLSTCTVTEHCDPKVDDCGCIGWSIVRDTVPLCQLSAAVPQAKRMRIVPRPALQQPLCQPHVVRACAGVVCSDGVTIEWQRQRAKEIRKYFQDKQQEVQVKKSQ